MKEYLDEAPTPHTTAGRQRRVDEISHLATSLSLLRGVKAEALSQLEAQVKVQQEQEQEGRVRALQAPLTGPSPGGSATSSSVVVVLTAKGERG